MKVKSLSRVRLLVTLWTAAYQAPQSMGFSRQEYWSRLPLPSPLEMEEMMSNLTFLNEEIKTEDECFISVSIYILYFIYLQSF